MKVAVILFSIIFCATTSSVGQQISNTTANSTPLHKSTFSISGSGYAGGTMAYSQAEGSDFSYTDFWDDYSTYIAECTVGQECSVPGLGISEAWRWMQGPSCLGATCTTVLTGNIDVRGSFITPDPGDQQYVELEVPVEVSGSINAFYQQYYPTITWPLWKVFWKGNGTAYVSLLNAGVPGELRMIASFTYTATATAQSLVSGLRTPGSLPTGVTVAGHYLYESEQGAFGTINQLDLLTGNVVRSFLSPSAAGFDGRSKPSDLTSVNDHLFMTDVGSTGAGTVYEIEPLASTVFKSFTIPFRGGAIAADQNRLFIGDLDGNQLLVTDHSGGVIRSLATPFQPAGMVFDPMDNLLWLIDRSSELKISQLTTKGIPIRTCSAPWNPYAPSDGNLVDGLGGVALRDSSLYIGEAGGYTGSADGPQPGTVSVFDSRTLACSPELPTRVRLDVKPGSFPNVINVKSNGVLPIAVLSTEHFDATQIDPASVRFGDTGTEAIAQYWSLADVNGDGRTDLQFKFKTQETAIACDTTLVSITGKMYSGAEIRGTDEVKVIGCK